MSNGGDCRTAPATPGLLKIVMIEQDNWQTRAKPRVVLLKLEGSYAIWIPFEIQNFLKNAKTVYLMTESTIFNH